MQTSAPIPFSPETIFRVICIKQVATMARAVINIKGIIGGKEAGLDAPSFNLADLITAVKNAGQVDGYDFVVDSDGGVVDEGFRIAYYIENLENTKAIAVNVSSIANVIYFAAQTREAMPGARWMLHTASGGVFGTAKDLRATADHLDLISNQIAEYIASRTDLAITDLKPLMEVDRYLDLAQAQAFGFLKGKIVNKNILAMGIVPDQIKPYVATIKNALKSAFGGKAVSMEVKLKDGNTIWVETEDGDFTKKRVFSEENGAPLENGEYYLEDGRELIVKDGQIEAETEDAGTMPPPANSDAMTLEAAMQKIAALEAENMKLKDTATEVTNLHVRLEAAEKQVQNNAVVISNLARLTSKDVKFSTPTQNLKADKAKPLSEAEQLKVIEEFRKRQ